MVLGSLASVFASTVLPVLFMAAIGYVLGRTKDLDPDPLNTVVLYVLLPALIFHSLVTTEIGGRTALKLVAAVGVFSLSMVALAEGVGRALQRPEPELSALVLASAFPNVGNFGIPVSEFAFGRVGRGTAVLFVVAQTVLMYTLGVYVAARSSAATGLRSVRRVFELPLVYVVVLALGVNALGVAPPADGSAMRTVELLGNASIPLFLFVLGIQLSNVDPGRALRRTAPAVALKLLVAPVVGVLVVLAVGFDQPLVARTFVLESAAPVAITPLVLLIEFGDDASPTGVSGPEYMGTVIFVTILASVPLVTVLIALLEAGVVV